MKINRKVFYKVGLLAISIVSVSCSQQRSQAVDQASQNLPRTLGCADTKSLVFDAFYEMIDQSQSVPLPSDMKASLQTEMDKFKQERHLSSDEAQTLDKITLEFFDLIDLMLAQSPDMTSVSWKEQIQKLIEYEMQDLSSEAIVQATGRIHQTIARINTLSNEASLACSLTYFPKSSNSSRVEAGQTLLTGIRRVFATAYQSCRVLDLPVMDRSTASVEGITIVGKHEDRIGSMREITNLKSVQNSHYYIKGIATESSCVKVADSPLIYDYGGSPAVSGSSLNFFKDAGSGTAVLGVDCSAFVSSAIAVVGFRYKPGLENKPIYTRQSSSKFIDAAKSGFTCFENVTVTAKQSVAAGDIVGVKGHVVIIDRVGKDPFGLSLVKNETECSKLDYHNFDMDIAQSDPSKGGIGINKYKLTDYLTAQGLGKMQTAFIGMAQQACIAKFQNKSIKPASSAWGFLRHKNSPECSAPRITLAGESCAKQCF